MADDFSANSTTGPIPAYFPTDTKDSLVPVYNQVGRFTGQLQKNGRVAVDAVITDTTDVQETDRTQTLLSDISAVLTTSDGVTAAEMLVEVFGKLSELSAKLSLLSSVTIFDGANIAAPGANTDILSTPIDMTLYPGVKTLLVTVALATSSVFSYMLGRGITAQVKTTLNSGTALVIIASYTFPIRVGPTDKINFQVVTDSVINRLYIEGAYSGIVS